MVTLDAVQFEMVKQYFNLLDTIEEGFDYVISSFENYEQTESDRIFADIHAAFLKIYETNQFMVQIFREDADVESHIDQFEDVVHEVNKLEDVIFDVAAKQRLIVSNINPVFITWKNSIQRALRKYIQQ
ncbi:MULTISPECIES: hypothetical protein [Bacillaceae]|uniref:hypothetical protein n=1 Tax=Bacillaceae TaxID=186817 RepID=UPI002A1612C5|nr:hypothetical protein [Cytobacillus sp. IB215316]MDX8360576.1 hypothetical protein [Cytobacillus sp. IB215316]